MTFLAVAEAVAVGRKTSAAVAVAVAEAEAVDCRFEGDHLERGGKAFKFLGRKFKFFFCPQVSIYLVAVSYMRRMQYPRE